VGRQRRLTDAAFAPPCALEVPDVLLSDTTKRSQSLNAGMHDMNRPGRTPGATRVQTLVLAFTLKKRPYKNKFYSLMEEMFGSATMEYLPTKETYFAGASPEF